MSQHLPSDQSRVWDGVSAEEMLVAVTVIIIIVLSGSAKSCTLVVSQRHAVLSSTGGVGSPGMLRVTCSR